MSANCSYDTAWIGSAISHPLDLSPDSVHNLVLNSGERRRNARASADEHGRADASGIAREGEGGVAGAAKQSRQGEG